MVGRDGRKCPACIVTRVYRRGKLSLAGWYLTVAVFWLMAATLSLAFVVCIVAVKPWDLAKIAFLAAIGLLTYCVARVALAYRHRVRNFRTSFLVLDETGVRFRLTGTPEIQVAWNEITGVKHEKRLVSASALMSHRLDTYTFLTPRGSFSFSAFDIPRPAQAATEIARRAGVEIRSI